MRATTIRWSDSIHRLVQEAADQEGSSFATYVRVATVGRIGLEWGLEAAIRSGDPEGARQAAHDFARILREAMDDTGGADVDDDG